MEPNSASKGHEFASATTAAKTKFSITGLSSAIHLPSGWEFTPFADESH